MAEPAKSLDEIVSAHLGANALQLIRYQAALQQAEARIAELEAELAQHAADQAKAKE
jgi:BMFP domain-containing protein YqiC